MLGDRHYSRLIDVALTLVVGGLILAAANGERVRAALARTEAAVAGTARVFGSDTLTAAARSIERGLASLEHQTYDQRLELRAAERPRVDDKRLLVVSIDDSSIARIGRWPWPRDRLADLLDGLTSVGATGALFDIEFPEASTGALGAAQDTRLAQALSGRPTFGMMFIERTATSGVDRLEEQAAAAAVERVLAGHAGPGSDRAEKLAAYLVKQPGAHLLDAIMDGVLPEIVPPRPPDDVNISMIMVLPAVLAVVLEYTGPIDEMARRSGLTAGYSKAFLAAPEHSAHMKFLAELVTFVSERRSTLTEVGAQLDRLRDRLIDRMLGEEIARAADPTDEAVLAALGKRLGAAGVALMPRARRLLELRRALEVVARRDLLALPGARDAALPVRGPVQPPTPELARGYGGLGVSAVDRDQDGVLRRIPLVFRVDASLPETLAGSGPVTVGLQATLRPAAQLMGLDLAHASLSEGYFLVPGLGGGPSLAVPVDDQARVLIDFRGRWGADGVPRINAAQVLSLVEARRAREAFLRQDANYLAHAIAMERAPSWRLPPGVLAAPFARALAPALAAHAALFRSGLESARSESARRMLNQLGLDVKSYRQAVDDAVRDHDARTEAEARAELARAREYHEEFLVRLPLLEEELERAVRGRFAFIGVTATGTTDISVMPFDQQYVNLGVHVNLLDQLISGGQLRLAPAALDGALFAMLLLLVCLVVPQLSISTGMVVLTLFSAGFVTLGCWLFVERGIVIAMATPLAAMMASHFVVTLRCYFLEERQKNRIRSMFETYLDPRVVELMVENEENWRELGGTVREITPYFSDMQAFATISELLSPEELSEMLADYLTPMTEIVLRHGGIRERFVGDAIVAFFGAPVLFPDHAARGCVAAVEQVEAMHRQRLEWVARHNRWYAKIRAAGLDIKFRVGLATGSAKVGNFGSRYVKNYSMNGDIVNLAARLEGMNKVYGTTLLCAADTYLQARDVIEAREIDRVAVVGKSQAVAIYEILGKKNAVAEPVIVRARRFEQALALYRAKAFAEAAGHFRELAEQDPLDGASRAYLGRIADAEYVAGLPGDWDGSFTARSK